MWNTWSRAQVNSYEPSLAMDDSLGSISITYECFCIGLPSIWAEVCSILYNTSGGIRRRLASPSSKPPVVIMNELQPSVVTLSLMLCWLEKSVLLCVHITPDKSWIISKAALELNVVSNQDFVHIMTWLKSPCGTTGNFI